MFIALYFLLCTCTHHPRYPLVYIIAYECAISTKTSYTFPTMTGNREQYVPQRVINKIVKSEQPPGDDVPVVDGNSPEAGGPAVDSMTKNQILELLKNERTPKTTSPAQMLTEIEGKLFSTTEFTVPLKDHPSRVVVDTRRGRQVLTLSSNRSGMIEKRNVRKLPPAADLTNVDHTSVHEALRQYNQDEVRGGLPTEQTLQKGAGLSHPTQPWEHRDRSDQGGWFSKIERERIQKTGKKK